jgi:hypothetical protein
MLQAFFLLGIIDMNTASAEFILLALIRLEIPFKLRNTQRWKEGLFCKCGEGLAGGNAFGS